jgi:hypothetical protein
VDPSHLRPAAALDAPWVVRLELEVAFVLLLWVARSPWRWPL